MKPALSLVFFTVLSGAGLGLAVFTAAFAGALPRQTFLAALALALLLVGGGLGASAAHLANPKNAWRAVMRVRSSWLSREAVLAAAFFPLALLCGIAGGGAAETLLRWALGIVALLTVYCTAMIYQSLKPIQQWHHPSTAFNYLALALMSGGVLFNLLAGAGGGAGAPSLLLALLCSIAAIGGKIFHYRRIGACQDISVGRATGFSQAKARLLDAGHTGPTFLTREFVYQQPAAALARRRRAACMLLLAAPPLALAAAAAAQPPLAAAAALAMLGGLLLERWLFFAEARHSVRAYHGNPAR